MIIPAEAVTGEPIPYVPRKSPHKPYTRASTFAKTLDDASGLASWLRMTVMLGFLRDDELADATRELLMGSDDPLNDPETKSSWRELTEWLHGVGGGNSAAELGTTWHLMTELIDRLPVRDPRFATTDDFELKRMAEYVEATSGYEMLLIEARIVNDKYKCAGTFDRLVRCPDGAVRIADLKTGSQDPKYPLAAAMQKRLYATGQLYEVETGARSPLHPDLDTDKGILIHLPAKGEGCQLYEMDLVAAERALEVAQMVREVRRIPARTLCVPLGS
jgi:hypothetical protein